MTTLKEKLIARLGELDNSETLGYYGATCSGCNGLTGEPRLSEIARKQGKDSETLFNDAITYVLSPVIAEHFKQFDDELDFFVELTNIKETDESFYNFLENVGLDDILDIVKTGDFYYEDIEDIIRERLCNKILEDYSPILDFNLRLKDYCKIVIEWENLFKLSADLQTFKDMLNHYEFNTLKMGLYKLNEDTELNFNIWTSEREYIFTIDDEPVAHVDRLLKKKTSFIR